LIRFDGVTERRADGGTAVGVPGGGLPVGPSDGNAAPWFRMIRPPTRGIPNDLRLVSRMSDRSVTSRVLSLTPFECNEMQQSPLGQAVTSGWVRSLSGQRENHS
jgi:hypothetical protein